MSTLVVLPIASFAIGIAIAVALMGYVQRAEKQRYLVRLMEADVFEYVCGVQRPDGTCTWKIEGDGWSTLLFSGPIPSDSRAAFAAGCLQYFSPGEDMYYAVFGLKFDERFDLHWENGVFYLMLRSPVLADVAKGDLVPG